MAFANTPTPPYYAVIFTSTRAESDAAGYAAMADEMIALAARQPGFLGLESARQELGITVSYWRDEVAIQAWKQNVQHIAAQRLGRERWYEAFRVRVARVEREYGYSKETDREAG
jgi:heme-degrading monooxygenase HmoA